MSQIVAECEDEEKPPQHMINTNINIHIKTKQITATAL